MSPDFETGIITPTASEVDSSGLFGWVWQHGEFYGFEARRNRITRKVQFYLCGWQDAGVLAWLYPFIPNNLISESCEHKKT
jgi:hypothetical protein